MLGDRQTGLAALLAVGLITGCSQGASPSRQGEGPFAAGSESSTGGPGLPVATSGDGVCLSPSGCGESTALTADASLTDAPSLPDMGTNGVPPARGGETWLPFLAAHAEHPQSGALLWSRVDIQNGGNAPEMFTLELHAPDGALAAVVTTAVLEVGESESIVVPNIVEAQWSGYGLVFGALEARPQVQVAIGETLWSPESAGWSEPLADGSVQGQVAGREHDFVAAASYAGSQHPAERWHVPLFPTDLESTLWVVNGGDEEVRVTVVEAASGTGAPLVLAEAFIQGQHGFSLASLGLSDAQNADLRMEATGPISVAVTASGSGESLLAYTPPRADGRIAPLVNVQPELGLDTVAHVTRAEAGPGPVSFVLAWMDAQGFARSCTAVEQDVPEGGRIAFDRARLAASPGPDCAALMGTEPVVGWGQSTGGPVVVEQLGASNERSSYAGLTSPDSARSLWFPLLRSGDPAVAYESDDAGNEVLSHYGRWSGIAWTNPGASAVEVSCIYRAGLETRTDTVIVPSRQTAHRQLYDVWGEQRFVGTGRCDTTGPVVAVVNHQFAWDGSSASTAVLHTPRELEP